MYLLLGNNTDIIPSREKLECQLSGHWDAELLFTQTWAYSKERHPDRTYSHFSERVFANNSIDGKPLEGFHRHEDTLNGKDTIKSNEDG